MAIFITAYLGKTSVESITFRDADGVAVTLNASDVVQIKIGRAGSEPVLEIASNVPASGGSTVTSANPATLTLDEDDLTPDYSDHDSIRPGVYDIEALVVDSGDANRVKHAESGVFSLINTQT